MLNRFRRLAPVVFVGVGMTLLAGPSMVMAQGAAQRQDRREEVKAKVSEADLSKLQEALKKGTVALTEDQKKQLTAALEQAVANKQLTEAEKAELKAAVDAKAGKLTEEQQAMLVAAFKAKYMGGAE